ncbi:MAG: hypothetical protein ABIO16_12915 [Nocardioides sp.]
MNQGSVRNCSGQSSEGAQTKPLSDSSSGIRMNDAQLLWTLIRPTVLLALVSLGDEFQESELRLREPDVSRGGPDVQVMARTTNALFDGWEDRNEIYAGLGLTFVESLRDGDLGPDSLAVVEDLVRQVSAGARAQGLSDAMPLRHELLSLIAGWSAGPPSDDEVLVLGSRLADLAQHLLAQS